MIASSTSRPSASTSAPSEILCRPISNRCMTKNVIASTSGIDTATTRPVRRPSEKKLTSNTITTASVSTLMNSPTESFTACGWSDTLRSSMPVGSVFCSRANCSSRVLPSWRMSPPFFIATAMPMASSPMKRILAEAGSAKPRLTSAMSPRRTVRSPERIGKSRISCTDLNWPVMRSCTRSVGVSNQLAGAIAFCCDNACCTCCIDTPSVASLVLDNSIHTFSSCRPSRSTLPTSSTRCSSSWMRSA
ncbi:hypothetical protein D3C81_649300 [compost metagenome]